MSFLALTTGWGVWQGRQNKSAEDYFLAGRSQHWVMVMFSIVATETSVLTFVSVPGLAYRGDWFFLQLAMGYIVGRILVSVFLLPAYFDSGIVSIYEVLGKRFGLVDGRKRSYREVGEELGVTAEAARRLVKRAVNTVRDRAGESISVA